MNNQYIILSSGIGKSMKILIGKKIYEDFILIVHRKYMKFFGLMETGNRACEMWLLFVQLDGLKKFCTQLFPLIFFNIEVMKILKTTNVQIVSL